MSLPSHDLVHIPKRLRTLISLLSDNTDIHARVSRKAQ